MTEGNKHRAIEAIRAAAREDRLIRGTWFKSGPVDTKETGLVGCSIGQIAVELLGIDEAYRCGTAGRLYDRLGIPGDIAQQIESRNDSLCSDWPPRPMSKEDAEKVVALIEAVL